MPIFWHFFIDVVGNLGLTPFWTRHSLNIFEDIKFNRKFNYPLRLKVSVEIFYDIL